MAAIIPTEAQEQIAVVQWLRLRGVKFLHVPNGSRCPVQYRSKLARLGLEPGAPDLLIFTPPPKPGCFIGTAIEMKRTKGGRLSDHQGKWLMDLADCGWCAMTCYGASHAIKELQALGY